MEEAGHRGPSPDSPRPTASRTPPLSTARPGEKSAVIPSHTGGYGTADFESAHLGVERAKVEEVRGGGGGVRGAGRPCLTAERLRH